MGRDVKRYFRYFHSFLDPGRLLASAKGACPAGAGGAPAGTRKLALELGEDKDLWSRTARWRKLLFPGSGGRERRGLTESLRSRALLIVGSRPWIGPARLWES